MSKTLSRAFLSLEDRSAALTSESLHDRILLRDYVIEAEIGAFQEERGKSQSLRFNMVAEVLSAGCLDDDVDKILSYDTLIDAIHAELTGQRINLLETLAENIAARILARPLAQRVYLRIEKLDRGPYALGVEIVRDYSLKEIKLDLPAPTIVFFEHSFLTHSDLPATLAELAGAEETLIMAVDFDKQTAEAGLDNPAVQKRIDLLSIEQQAWRLAALDRRCLVVRTHTELDWAMRNKKITVWAPAKLVMDRPDLRKACVDSLIYAHWLADFLNAKRLIIYAQKRALKPIAGTDIIWRGKQIKP